MKDRAELPEEFRDLVDGYCDGLLNEDEVGRLEGCLLGSAEARREFIVYFQMHTELAFAVRARGAASAALGQVEIAAELRPLGARSRRWGLGRGVEMGIRRWAAVAAGLMIALVGYWAGNRYGSFGGLTWRGGASVGGRASGENVAWLVNAQDCEWEAAAGDSVTPGRDMGAGKTLRLMRGLAEIEFERGARLILQGPAGLQLISGNEARLLHGSLTARVPVRAVGFTVYSPQGKVVDLGTEFGLSVDDQGATAVRVFEGRVVASPIAATGLTIHEDETARIVNRRVAIRPKGIEGEEKSYVRAIVPPPIVTARAAALNFTTEAAGTLLDAEGKGVGLTHRLPGTGKGLAERDGNLRLDTSRGALELTTTRSDLNTQQGMSEGEYLGFKLCDLGFKAEEDFEVSARIPKIPGLASVGQFGLYAGSRSDRIIRGGLISQPTPDHYVFFLVNNNGGDDSNLYEVGLINTGDDLRLTMRRVAGKYSLVVENLTKHSSSTLRIEHPAFLDGLSDLQVGFFGANAQSDVRKTLIIKEFSAKVWTVFGGGATGKAKK